MTIQSEIQALKCADCARSDSAVSDLRPDSLLPIPADALSGWQDGRPGSDGVTRRKLLRNGVLGFAAVYGATQLSFEEVWEAAVAQAAEPMQKSIVVIYLNGGNDGLNCFVPTSAPEFAKYQTLRPTIARSLGDGVGGKVGTTIMNNTGGTLAFSNKLVSGTGADRNGDVIGFDTLYGDGTGGVGSDLAIIPAADYNPPNRSHFESRDYWFAGALSQLQTGWLGRWLDTYGSQVNPLQAVSLDSSLSKQIRSATAPVCALEGLQNVGFGVPGVTADVNSEVGKLAAVPFGATNAALGRSRNMMGLTVDVANRLSTLSNVAPGPGYPPNSGLSQKLQLAATLLSAGMGTRVITIDWGSFDTHGDQLAGQDPQLSTLSRSLAAFKADLAARGVEQNVITMVFSEFGRRLEESDSAGTDHGSGGPIMLSGSAVKGGLAGEHPGVNVNQDGDLVVKTDFRTVYQALISEWLGGDPNAILPGGPFDGIHRYDGGTTLTKAA
ncbi:MAG TPA: DUF1501 domain-containing protein [Gaiellales bacterium]|jgi:uncharacterized protein (DUF1501 family)